MKVLLHTLRLNGGAWERDDESLEWELTDNYTFQIFSASLDDSLGFRGIMALIVLFEGGCPAGLMYKSKTKKTAPLQCSWNETGGDFEQSSQIFLVSTFTITLYAAICAYINPLAPALPIFTKSRGIQDAQETCVLYL